MATTKKTTSKSTATATNKKENKTMDKLQLTTATIIDTIEASEDKPQNYYKVTKDNIIRDKNYYNGELLTTNKNQILLVDAEQNYYIVRAQNDHTVTRIIKFGETEIIQTETVNDTQTKILNRFNYQNNTKFTKLSQLKGQQVTITHLYTTEGYSYYEFTNFRALDREANLLPENN